MRARLRVRVTPRGGRDAIVAIDDDGVVRVRVAAAPADGKANESVARLIARAAGVPSTSVTVVSGLAARIKTLEVEGIADEELRSRLRASVPASRSAQ